MAAAPLPLRSDFDATILRREARRSRDAAQARRLLALAAICAGASRREAAKIGGVTLQIVRDRVVRFNAEGPAGLIDRKPPGSTPKLGLAERQALLQIVEPGPMPTIHGVVRWRRVDLAQWVREEFRISISTRTLSRELRAQGYRKLSARPRHHAQAPQSLAEHEKGPRSAGAGRAARRRWETDRNLVRRRDARRPVAPHHPPLGQARYAACGTQRTASAYIFGAICPKLGKGAALILPRCDIIAMNLHLQEIAAAVDLGVHAVLLLDQAGWHMSANLVVPPNITIMPLPPKAPELTPVENLWQYMRDNWLSNRSFHSYEDALNHACAAWPCICGAACA